MSTPSCSIYWKFATNQNQFVFLSRVIRKVTIWVPTSFWSHWSWFPYYCYTWLLKGASLTIWKIKLVKWLWIVEKESVSLGQTTNIHLSSSVNVNLVGSKSKRVQNICSFQKHVSSLNLNVLSTLSSTQAKKHAYDRYVVGVYQRGDATGEKLIQSEMASHIA